MIRFYLESLGIGLMMVVNPTKVILSSAITQDASERHHWPSGLWLRLGRWREPVARDGVVWLGWVG